MQIRPLMGKPESMELAAISRWLHIHEPDLFIESPEKNLPVDAINEVSRMTKSYYFDLFEKAWTARASERGGICGTIPLTLFLSSASFSG